MRSATLYDAKDAAFARWQRPPETSPSHAPTVAIEHLLRFDQRPVGRLVLDVRLDELARQSRNYAWLASVLALLTWPPPCCWRFGCSDVSPGRSWIWSTPPARSRNGRIFRCACRVPRAEREIGTLVQGFNQMLAQIEQRETALDQANTTLQRLATDLSLLEETEKARLAAELHDGPMQKLALAQMQIDAAAEGDETTPTAAKRPRNSTLPAAN